MAAALNAGGGPGPSLSGDSLRRGQSAGSNATAIRRRSDLRAVRAALFRRVRGSWLGRQRHPDRGSRPGSSSCGELMGRGHRRSRRNGEYRLGTGSRARREPRCSRAGSRAARPGATAPGALIRFAATSRRHCPCCGASASAARRRKRRESDNDPPGIAGELAHLPPTRRSTSPRPRTCSRGSRTPTSRSTRPRPPRWSGFVHPDRGPPGRRGGARRADSAQSQARTWR